MAETRVIPDLAPVSSSTVHPQVKAVEWPNLAAVKKSLQEQARAVAVDAPAWLLVYTDPAVGWGWVDSSMVATVIRDLLEPLFINDLRLFGSAGEWHVWRQGNTFHGRLLQDAHFPKDRMMEEFQALWGTRVNPGPEDGWSTLREDRGVALSVPHTGLRVNAEKPLRLQVRHFLAVENDTHLTTVIDSRLVALCDHMGVPLSLDTRKED